MTVLYFADTRFPIERANGLQTIETCHALARRGHDVTLFVRPDSAAPARDPLEFYGLPPEPRLRIETIASGGGPRGRRARFLLSATRIAAARHDAVIFTRDLGLAAWLLQFPRATRPRLVYESHGLSMVVAEEMPALLGKSELAASTVKLRRLDRRERRVWTRAAAYVAITRELAHELGGRYGLRPRVFVAPDGARPADGVPPPDTSRFVAGYAGHLYPWKGVDVFIRALGHAPGVHGLIVGGHPGEADVDRIRQLAAREGVASRLTITGLVPPRDVARALAPASVLVLPNPASAISERYTSPLKLFEYLTMGRPIVASDLPAIREVLSDEETALLVPPGHDRALAGALLRLQQDPALAAALGRAALALSPSFTWDARAERVEAALNAALAA